MPGGCAAGGHEFSYFYFFFRGNPGKNSCNLLRKIRSASTHQASPPSKLTNPEYPPSDTVTASYKPQNILALIYSIVLPAYNEGARIGATLQKILNFAAVCGWSLEVIVVNDGSTDNTAELVRQHAIHNPMLRLVENPGNRGKGYSVRNGMLHAQGDTLIFSDADLSSPIEEASKLIFALEDGADIAIGSRWLEPELQTTRQPLRRQIFGRMFNLALRLILGLHFKDTQCGFKAFSRQAVEAIFPLQKIERWGFDPEILFLAKTLGFKVKEVPVAWAHREGGGINPVRDGIRMLGEMLRIRWNSLTGKYKARQSELKSFYPKP